MIHQIQFSLYEFPELEPEDAVVESASMKGEKTQDYRKRIPFAVVGSNQVKEDPKDSTRKIRFREYPWGIVEVENMKHNDFRESL